MKIYKIKDFLSYPDHTDWYDFSNGVDVSSDRINEWMQECFESIRKEILSKDNQGKASTYIRSGNSTVIVFAYRNEDLTYDIDFIVTKNYIHGEVFGWNPIEDVEFEKIK
jgi:serine protease inhibitor